MNGIQIPQSKVIIDKFGCNGLSKKMRLISNMSAYKRLIKCKPEFVFRVLSPSRGTVPVNTSLSMYYCLHLSGLQ